MSNTRKQARLRPVIRVFVSSTFSDMKHERNALAADVFPKLEQLCQRHGFQFQAIDLRWGVSTEAGLDHRTMRICFEELRRAQEISPEPNFLVLLGDRYGWRPLPEAISHAEFEKLAEVARTGGANQAPLPGAHGKAALQVLEEWYRCDKNVVLPDSPETDPNRAPLNYLLQPRTQDLGDARDYKRGTHDPTKDTQDWMDVQEVLWRLVNAAFPAHEQWLDIVDWPKHVADVNAPLHHKRAIPQVVRFQASATEQEIWCGALSAANAERHVIACFREIANRDDFTATDAKDFFDVVQGEFDAVSAKRQSDLKAAIQQRLGERKYLPIPFKRLKRENGKVLVEASEADTRAFCDAVFERFRPIIERQIEEYWDKSAKDSPARSARELKIEQDEHERFGRERGGKESFVGRDTELEAIRNYLGDNSRWPLVVHGSSGCGKTALMWRAFEEIPETRKPIIRLIGTTPHSSDLRGLLTSLFREMRQRNPRADALPTEIKELRDEFSQHLQAATPEQPLILFLDALDQLADADNGRLLNWLPPGSLPAHVKLIVSCLSDRGDDPAGQPYAELKRPYRQIPAENFINLDVLSEAEARLLLFDRWLPEASRKVSNDQRARIEQRLASPACRQPIFLKLLFEEVQLWHSYDPATVLGESVPALLGQLFDRLSQPTNHGPLLVNRVLGYLSASRHGLAENEILEILFADPEYRTKLNEATEQTRHELPPKAKRIPIALWSRLRFDLAPYLTERAAPGANVLTFYHRQLAEFVKQDYLADENHRRETHTRLADYFSIREEGMTPRKADEWPWELLQAGNYSDLVDLLVDMWNMLPLARLAYGDVLNYWRILASHADMILRYEKAWSDVSATTNHSVSRIVTEFADMIARLLEDSGYWRAALAFYDRFLQRRTKEHNAQGLSVQTGRRNYAACLARLGNYSEAEPLLRTALSELLQLLGPHDPSVLDTATDLALVLQAQGDIDGAQNLHSWTYNSCFGGKVSKQAALHALAFAKFLKDQAREDEALEIAQQAAEALETILGSRAREALLARLEVADIRCEIDACTSDISNLTQVANALVDVLGADHPQAKAAVATATGWNRIVSAKLRDKERTSE
jgi:hypothetical protein